VRFVQSTFDFADPRAAALSQTTFVVVDLETTGGAATAGDGITEIGAVKVRGGEDLGEFATLVCPSDRIPPFVTVLTGITEAMVAPAPKLDSVLPAFLEFADGAVWVAHNAPYDVGFLKAACLRHGYRWPAPLVLDTAALARRALINDEVPNRRLATLAAHFHTRTPNHRALNDARATIDVLHALFERMSSFGVYTVGDAIEFGKAVTPTQRRQRHLAEGLPDAPGVYLFRGRDDRTLYVGTSGSIATRVKTYFTASEKRARISEMLAAAVRVEAVVCAHRLEAEVRELRLIAAHKPPYNRRSKFPERTVWLKLTNEAYPRLSIVRQHGVDGATYLGPFSSRRVAETAAEAVYDALPVRQCTHALSARKPTPACVLAELGKCLAPCQLEIDVAGYDHQAAAPFRTAVTGDPSPVVTALLRRMEAFADRQRYEEAAIVRHRLTALLRTTIRMQRLTGLASIAHLVAARPGKEHNWEFAVIRYGRLAGAALSPPRLHPGPTIDAMVAAAETVEPGTGPTPRASAEETERILNWLEGPGTRLVQASSGWALPAQGAGRWRSFLSTVEGAAGQPHKFAEGKA
jgi:DNA polymerase-3 subunit epsilon